MDPKTLSVISYITIIGWLIAYLQYKDRPKEALISCHLKQSPGIAIVSIIVGVILSVLVSMVPAMTVHLPMNFM